MPTKHHECWEIMDARNLGCDVTYVHPYRLTSRASACTDCRGGDGEGREHVGTGVFGQFSVAGNHVAALHLANPRFSGGKS